MSLNDTNFNAKEYRVLVPHWEAAIDGKPFAIVTAGTREAARELARRHHRNGEYLTPQEQERVTVRYLCNK